MTVVKMEGNIELRYFRAKGGNWVAICDPLGLTIQAKTWANLMEDFTQSVNAIFTDLLKSQELLQFLRDRGWRLEGPIPSRPADVWFDVPFVTRTADRDSEVALR